MKLADFSIPSASGVAGRQHDGPIDDKPEPRLRLCIESAVVSVFAIERCELLGSSRGHARIALARQAAMYVAHVTLGLSMIEVGRMFSRDRTTVKHACAVIEDRRDDAGFDHTVERLEGIVRRLERLTAPGREDEFPDAIWRLATGRGALPAFTN